MRTSRTLQHVFRLGVEFTGRVEDVDPVECDLHRSVHEDEVASLVYEQVTGDWAYVCFDEPTTDRLHEEFNQWLETGRPTQKLVKLLVVDLTKDLSVAEAASLCRLLGLGEEELPATQITKLAGALRKVAAPELERSLQEMLSRWQRLGFFDPVRMAKIGKGPPRDRSRERAWSGFTPSDAARLRP